MIPRWNRQFSDSLRVKNYAVFLCLLGQFGVLTALHIAIAVFAL